MPIYWHRAFIFADMNAFFAGVEQMDNPALRGKPVVITNGMTGTCVITCSYEARAVGIYTGCHLRKARELCPEVIRRPSRPERYVQISTRIMRSMEQFSPDIEISSVDEVYLDVTHCQRLLGDPVSIARNIKETIFSVSGVKASVGVADSKLIAKWAANLNKPDGFTIIEPGDAKHRLQHVPVMDICGINKGTAKYLAAHGAHTCGDVARLPISVLGRRFGNIGRRLHMVCCGSDPEPIVHSVTPAKSIGHGKVIPPNTRNPEIVKTYLLHMCFKVAARLRLYNFRSGHFHIGIRTKNGWCSGDYKIMPTDNMMTIFDLCRSLINDHWDYSGASQVHVTAVSLVNSKQADCLEKINHKQQQLNLSLDSINSRFGELTLAPAKLLNRSTMPNVIAPSWKPFGHRETILAGKYSKQQMQKRAIPFLGYVN